MLVVGLQPDETFRLVTAQEARPAANSLPHHHGRNQAGRIDGIDRHGDPRCYLIRLPACHEGRLILRNHGNGLGR